MTPTQTGLAGVFPAVVTPIDKNEQFMPEAFERLLSRLYAAGVDGVYVGGQTGEGTLQPLDMREAAAELAIRHSPKDKKVVVHVGTSRTADAIRLARHAARMGAHAVSSLPPLGLQGLGEIRHYYEQLAAASDLPLMIYYFPDLAPALNSYEEIAALCRIPNVIGLKFTDFNLFTLTRLKEDGMLIWNGRDEVFAAGLLMGADGGVGTFYNVIPEWFVEVYRLMQERRADEAMVRQRQINKYVAITLRYPPLPSIKAILRRSGLDCGVCLAPRQELDAQTEARLVDELAAAGVLPVQTVRG